MTGCKIRFLLVMVIVLAAASQASAQPGGGGGGGPGAAMSGRGPMNPAAQQFFAGQRQKGLEFQEQESQEAKDFMATLAGKPKAEKLAAIREFKIASYEKNCAFRDKLWAEADAFFATQMAGGQGQAANPRAARMQERRAEQTRQTREFFAGKHAENLAFLDAAMQNAALDGPALDQTLQDFFQKQKAEAKDFMEQRRGGHRGGTQTPGD